MPGPKPKPAAEKRTHTKLLRFSPAEWSRLNADYLRWRSASKAPSVTLADFIRFRLGL